MADENPDPRNQPQSDPESESLRLKTLAEQKYVAGNLKSALKYAKRAHRLHPSLEGVEELLTALEILRTAAIPISPTPTDDTTSSTPAPPDYYKILRTERFAHINTIKKQYKKLALALHPDKNPFVASEEAFKYVGEGFRVLSDRIRRKEYDMKLRIAMQNEAEAAAAGGFGIEVEELHTFWTACSTCRLLHKFERKYLGHILVCPSCKKSFEAVEVVEEDTGTTRGEEGKDEVEVVVRISERIKAKRIGKMSSVGEILDRSRGKVVELKGKRMEKDLENVGKKRGLGTRDGGGLGVIEGVRVKRVGLELKDMAKKRAVGRSGGRQIEGLSSRSGRQEERIEGVEVVKGTRTGAKRLKVVEEEMMTLAEMQLLVKKKVSDAKLKGKEQGKDKEKEKEQDEEGQVNEKDIENENMEEEEEEESEKEMEMEEEEEMGKDREKEQKINKRKRKMGVRKVVERERKGVSNDETMAVLIRKASRSNGVLSMEKCNRSGRSNLQIVAMHNSDFYEFDKDRAERSFKKGQVWAIYDSEDGIPRHYGLIDDVVCVDPFEVRLSWLEYESSSDHQLISLEKMGCHVSCGRFKVSEKATVKSVKMFSHLADCERAAREVYRIYPRKDSVWAIYNEHAMHSERNNQTMTDDHCYDIVVFLTNYSDIHGSSMAYLEKVDGMKTIFKRREIGPHAIRFLEKDEFKLLSHQIPGRKLSGEEAPGLPKYCWELDPASLPSSALTSGWEDTNAL